MAQFEFRSLVLDPQIGHGNLSIDDLRPCFSAFFPSRFGRLLRPEQRQVAIQIPLEFIVEDHADQPSSALLDAGSLFLVEPVEIGIVFDFARLRSKPW